MSTKKSAGQKRALRNMRKACVSRDPIELLWASVELFVEQTADGSEGTSFSGRDVNAFLIQLLEYENSKDNVDENKLIQLQKWQARSK